METIEIDGMKSDEAMFRVREVAEMVAMRRRRLAEGTYSAEEMARVAVVVKEASTLLKEIPLAREVFERVGRCGPRIGMLVELQVDGMMLDCFGQSTALRDTLPAVVIVCDRAGR